MTSEAPVIDTRKVETGAVMTNDELRDIPTGRDPWVLLQSVPGVQVDRVNVAGSESGQQSTFDGKGTVAGTFTLDGVNYTDMAALGASNGYYDFETFQEVQVVTGGSDPALQGAGAHINMITKRGTNEVHGSARINVVSDSFQGTNYPPSKGRRKISSVQEYGAEVGGPILRDTLWLWGSYGRNQINLLVGSDTPPTKSNTTLENFNGKLNWQVIPSNSFSAWYQHSDKIVLGRGAGATCPQSCTRGSDASPKHLEGRRLPGRFLQPVLFRNVRGGLEFLRPHTGGQGTALLRREHGLFGDVVLLPGAGPATETVSRRIRPTSSTRVARSRAEGGLPVSESDHESAVWQPGESSSGEQPESARQGRRLRQRVSATPTATSSTRRESSEI